MEPTRPTPHPASQMHLLTLWPQTESRQDISSLSSVWVRLPGFCPPPDPAVPATAALIPHWPSSATPLSCVEKQQLQPTQEPG